MNIFVIIKLYKIIFLMRCLRVYFMSSIYYNNLINTVLNYSNNANWETAVLEWAVADCEKDGASDSSCICGKENLRYLFKIRNQINGKYLYYTGSTCIKNFNRDDLNYVVSIKEGLFKLLHAIDNKDFITLEPKYFSRKLLKHLYAEGAFQSSQYNMFNPEKDYKFLLKMYNKTSISEKQKNMINAIIFTAVKPYLKSILLEKMKNIIKLFGLRIYRRIRNNFQLSI